MKIIVVGKYEKDGCAAVGGFGLPTTFKKKDFISKINKRGFEEIDVDVQNINTFSFDNKEIRAIGIGKDLYKLSMKSFKELKRSIARIGNNKFNYSKM